MEDEKKAGLSSLSLLSHATINMFAKPSSLRIIKTTAPNVRLSSKTSDVFVQLQRSARHNELFLKTFSRNQKNFFSSNFAQNLASSTHETVSSRLIFGNGGYVSLLAIFGALVYGILQGVSLDCSSEGSETDADAQGEDLYSLTAKDINGKEVKFSKFKGQVLLVVNVACNCGYTHKNYTELVQLYNKYKDQGFQILAFPSNQFWGQEPGTNAEILQYVKSKYGVEFMLFEKTEVNGPNAHPIYNFLKKSSGDTSDIGWNFSKFLVDKNGHVFKRYPTSANPLKIEEDIQSLLKS